MLRQFHSNFCLFLCLFFVCVCLIPRTHPSVAAHTARKTTETFDNCREQQQQKKIKHKKALVIEIRKKKRTWWQLRVYTFNVRKKVFKNGWFTGRFEELKWNTRRLPSFVKSPKNLVWKTSLNFCFFLRKRNNHYQVCEVQRFERHVFAPSGEANTIVFPSRRINWRKNELSTFDCPLSEWIFFWRLWKKKRIIQLTLVVFGFGNRLATELKKKQTGIYEIKTRFLKNKTKKERVGIKTIWYFWMPLILLHVDHQWRQRAAKTRGREKIGERDKKIINDTKGTRWWMDRKRYKHFSGILIYIYIIYIKRRIANSIENERRKLALA